MRSASLAAHYITQRQHLSFLYPHLDRVQELVNKPSPYWLRMYEHYKFKQDLRRLSAEFSQVRIQTTTPGSLKSLDCLDHQWICAPPPISNVELVFCIFTCEISADQTPPRQGKSEIAQHFNIEWGARGIEISFDFAWCFHLRKFCRQQYPFPFHFLSFILRLNMKRLWCGGLSNWRMGSGMA